MNTAAEPPLAAAHVAANHRSAWGGVWRLTLARFLTARHLLVFFILAALFIALSAANYRPRRPFGGYWDWMCAFYLTVLLPALSFMSGAAAIREDLKSNTVDYVFTRPISRIWYVVYRFFAHLGCLQVGYLLLLGGLWAIGDRRGVTNLNEALPALLAAQMGVITAFVAFGFLAGTISSRYLLLGLLYVAVIEVGLGSIPTQLSRLAITHVVRSMVQPYWYKAPPVIAGAPVGESLVLLLAFATGMVALAAIIFSRRQFTGASNTDL